MTSIQTTVTNKFPVGYAGQLTGFTPNRVDSYVNGEASAAIDLGLAVMRGSSAKEVLRASGLNAQLVGITTHSHALNTTGNNEVEANDPVGVLIEGDIYVQPEVTVAKFDPVYVRVVAAGAEVLGALRNDEDGGDAIRLPGAYFYTAGTSSEVAWVRLTRDAVAADVDLGDSINIPVSHIQVTADATQFAYEVPANKTFVVDSVTYYNATGLAEDAANYFHLKVQDAAAAKVAADWSTETGQEGSIAADTPVTLTAGTLANRTFAAGTRINVFLDETGTATLPAGQFQINGRLK
jgi:hypothetical protein